MDSVLSKARRINISVFLVNFLSKVIQSPLTPPLPPLLLAGLFIQPQPSLLLLVIAIFVTSSAIGKDLFGNANS